MTEAIEQANTKINAIEVPIQRLDERIATLQLQITNRRTRIDQLKVQFKEQAVLIKRLGREVSIARERLTSRAIAVYKDGETSTDSWIIGANSISEAFERKDAVDHIVSNDDDVLKKIEGLERKIRVKRAKNHSVRARIASDIKGLKVDEDELASQRATLATKKAQLDAAQAERNRFVRQLRGRQENLEEQFDDLEENSEQVYKAIKEGASSFGSGVLPPGMSSTGGLGWPVNGPVVSPFGPRWGRLHAGIDIAVPAGVPIYASGSGVVTHAGWMSGYGNMVIIQHAGALSTGYAHQSRIGVSQGQFVSKGMLIGYVGCTGHCFGDHVHFETRVNGVPQNPMSYL
jgi:murein DD-endopeptidase MepM/ murein hydrolase activator NlpD